MRLQKPIFHFEKQRQLPGKYLNSPPLEVWTYCGSFRGRTAEEASIRAMFKVGSSQIRLMPEFDGPDNGKGYL